MDPVVLVSDDEPREHHGEAAVSRGVADPILAGRLRGRVDDELACRGIVGGGRLEIAHVGAVSGLRHRVAAGQLQSSDGSEVRLVVPPRAELEDAPPEEPELDAELHDDAQVPQGERLESRDRRAGVSAPSEHLRVAERPDPFVGEQAYGVEDTLPVLVVRKTERNRHLGAGEQVPRVSPYRGVVTLEELSESIGS